MSSEEQRRILKMVEDGRISADEAMILIRALEQKSPVAEMEVIEVAPGSGSEKTDAPEFEEVKQRARRFAMIPLWIGVGGTVLSRRADVLGHAEFGFWVLVLLPDVPVPAGRVADRAIGGRHEFALAVRGCAPEAGREA
jgi:hypothetical protein